MTLKFVWDPNTLHKDDRAVVDANLKAELPNACEYFDLESQPQTVALSLERGNTVIRGVVTNRDAEEIILLTYHLSGAHTAMYRTPGRKRAVA